MMTTTLLKERISGRYVQSLSTLGCQAGALIVTYTVVGTCRVFVITSVYSVLLGSTFEVESKVSSFELGFWDLRASSWAGVRGIVRDEDRLSLGAGPAHRACPLHDHQHHLEIDSRCRIS